jgi:hypothetical protein
MRYEAEIGNLEIVLNNLRLERQTLHAYSEGCRSVLAPIRRVPSELLVGVFSLVPDPEVIEDSGTPDEALDMLAKHELLVLP